MVDKTELKGKWNFDLKWPRNADSQVAVDEIGKQLGLKLEPEPIPTPVLTVVSVNKTPTANGPGVAEALPVNPEPTAFDVATIKPTDPDYKGPPTFGRQSSSLWGGQGAFLSDAARPEHSALLLSKGTMTWWWECRAGPKPRDSTSQEGNRQAHPQARAWLRCCARCSKSG